MGMKVLLLLATVFAASQANDVCKANFQNLADLKMETLKMRLRNGESVESVIASLPPSTEDCSWATGLSCATIIGCVQEAIGAGDSCWPCICWVIEWLLGDGYC